MKLFRYYHEEVYFLQDELLTAFLMLNEFQVLAHIVDLDHKILIALQIVFLIIIINYNLLHIPVRCSLTTCSQNF